MSRQAQAFFGALGAILVLYVAGAGLMGVIQLLAGS